MKLIAILLSISSCFCRSQKWHIEHPFCPPPPPTPKIWDIFLLVQILFHSFDHEKLNEQILENHKKNPENQFFGTQNEQSIAVSLNPQKKQTLREGGRKVKKK